MAKRYIIIPPPVKLLVPETDQPLLIEETGQQAEASFATAMRQVCNEMLKAQAMDTLDIIELRMALTLAKEGEEVEVEAAWQEALLKAFARPVGFTLFYMNACRPHILAIKNATDTPRVS